MIYMLVLCVLRGNTGPFEEMSQRWRAIGNTVSDMTGPRFEPQTSHSTDESIAVRPTVPKLEKQFFNFFAFLLWRIKVSVRNSRPRLIVIKSDSW